MESKVNRALLLKQFLASFVNARQNAIDSGDFENAMTNHFFWLLHAEEYMRIRKSMTDKENDEYFEASVCIDHK